MEQESHIECEAEEEASRLQLNESEEDIHDSMPNDSGQEGKV